MARSRILSAMALFILAPGHASAEPERDYLFIVGSTTIAPFSEMVVERFMDKGDFKAPMVQTLGSAGGLSLFCNGLHALDPDIAYASRPIRQSEIEKCRTNGVQDIVEIKIGYDGIVLAQSREGAPLNLSRRDIYLALAKFVRNSDDGDTYVENPHKAWREVNETLPATAIEVWGPKKGSGTRYVFARLAMEAGCRTVDGMIELANEDLWQYREVCRTVRDDKAYLDVGEEDELNAETLKANPHALAILPFGIEKAYEDTIRAVPIDGIEPTYETISNSSYLLSRPLYLYVKKANADLYPGMREFIAEFTSDGAWGPTGYLRAKGLVAMQPEERRTYTEIAKQLTPLPE